MLEEARNRFFPRASEEVWPCQNLNLGQVRWILDFWPIDLWDNKLLFFFLFFLLICYSNHRKLIYPWQVTWHFYQKIVTVISHFSVLCLEIEGKKLGGACNLLSIWCLLWRQAIRIKQDNKHQATWCTNWWEGNRNRYLGTGGYLEVQAGRQSSPEVCKVLFTGVQRQIQDHSAVSNF